MVNRLRLSSLGRTSLGAVLLAALIFSAYAYSLRGEFLWDDDLHITANPTIIGPLGLKEIWTTARANYFPLVLSNFWLQHALWGLDPFGYRVVTLLFHVGAALLLWRVLRQLRVPGAWLGAAIWALHPVQVESVAWICELKNTQSAAFFLAAIACYVRWLATERARGVAGLAEAGPGATTPATSEEVRILAVTRDHRPYALALMCALLAILSKPSTVMLPVALALCAWWSRRRLHWRDLLPLGPFFVLSALAAGWTIWEQQHHSGAIGEAWNQTWAERGVIAGRVGWFYLGKLAWPEPLIFIYPRWTVSAASLGAWLPCVGAGLTLVALAMWARRSAAGAAVFFATAYFGVLLFPVLGFFSVYFFRYSFVGDHFQYLASMGPLALAGAGLARMTLSFRATDGGGVPSPRESPRLQTRARLPRSAWLGAVLVLSLALLTAREAREYLNNEALWRATLARNPHAIMAWLNLGDTYLKQGRLEEAVATFTHVTRIKPDEADAFNDLGGALLQLDRPGEALAALEQAAALAPRRAEVANNLGSAQQQMGRAAEALASFRRALALDPEYAEAHNNLGAELAEAGQTREALAHFETALRLAPRSIAALNNLGNTLRTLGRLEEAIARHRAALQIKPDFPDALASLGYALVLQGRADEGLPLGLRAVALRPQHAGIRGRVGRALAAAGRVEEAQAQFARAVELAPHSAEAHNNLGTALAQLGRTTEARASFERAVQLAPRFAGARINLGNALLAAGRWADAAAQFEPAAALQPENADVALRLAVARVNAGRPADAVPAFTTALRLRPESAEVHEQFAQVLRALGRSREALEHFERAADLRRARP
jgi:tetratricopeptide (TPR) repeat protein